MLEQPQEGGEGGERRETIHCSQSSNPETPPDQPESAAPNDKDGSISHSESESESAPSSSPMPSSPDDKSVTPTTTALSSSSSSSTPAEIAEVTDADASQEPSRFSKFILAVWQTLKRWFAPPAFIVGILTGVTLSLAIIMTPGPLGARDALLREKVTLFDVILHDINDSYVDVVDMNRLFEAGVNSMLGTLDPYSQFENNAQALEMSVKKNGRYAGVGLGLALGKTDSTAQEDRPIVVVSAFEGYAFDAGVRPGDVIHSVSGERVTGASLEKVTEMLRGEPGTKVDVTVNREGFQHPLPFTLARKSVHIKDVTASARIGPSHDVAYIRLQSFAKDAAEEVSTSIAELQSNGRPVRGVVLDLRSNPGGLLNAAIEVAELFVPKGSTIVSTKGRGLGPSPAYTSSRDPILPVGTPLVVLVDWGTASASEIVAGAVQDLDLGVVIGTPTFGKGLVQNVQELPFNTALKYTVGKYYTPSGRCIQRVNYGRSEGDGPFEAKRIEESQRQEFKTVKGRVVRDGGGIEPDVDLQKPGSLLESALQRQNMYFQFANRFGADVKLEKLPVEFTVTDSIYKDFVKFVSNSGFTYESGFEEAFDELDKLFKDIGYEGPRGMINDLRKTTTTEMRSEFLRYERDIRVRVESAIRYRFQPDSQRIIAELKNDDKVAEAIRVLTDENVYVQLLSPKENAAITASSGNGNG